MTTTTAAGRECVLGIDVSTYQQAVDWRTVASCRQFAVIKASGGDGRGWSNYPDGMFATHRANSAGLLPRGAYHFLGGGNGAAQADYFVRATGGYQGLELPPVVDVEIEGLSQAVVADFANEIHQQISRRWTGPTGEPVALIIYSGASWAKYMRPEYARFDLWLAAYMSHLYPNPWQGVTNTAAPNVAALAAPDRYVVAPWRTWSAWQFAGGDGGCPGVGNGFSQCDQNVMTTDTFHRLTGGGSSIEGGLSMADAQAILDKLAEIETTIGSWDSDTRAEIVKELTSKVIAAGMTSRQFTFRVANEPTVWLVAFGEHGAVRMAVPDQTTLYGLIDIGAISPDLSIDELDQGRAAALLAIREVPWTVAG